MSRSGLAFVLRKTSPQVLLVDDEIDHLLPLADALRGAGFAACIATSRDEALFDVASSPPAVVVLDADMADRLLLSRLRGQAALLPIVLTSTAPATEPRIAALLAITGVVYLAKPIEAAQLVALLSSAGLVPSRAPAVLAAV